MKAKHTKAAARVATDFDIRFGARLREERTARGISLHAVADHLERSMPQVARYETGFSTMDVPTFLGFATFIGIRPGRFLEEFAGKCVTVAAAHQAKPATTRKSPTARAPQKPRSGRK